MVSCASTYEPQYLYPEATPIFPLEKKVERTFYLVGDAGISPMGGMSDALTTLNNLIASEETEGDYAIFLGDNIYPDGMPTIEDAERKFAENHMDAQLKSVENFKGETIFIPGNHDWYNSGLSGLLREQEYLKEASGKDLLKPSGGCPLESIAVSESIQLITIDTQWYLEDWNRDPAINEFCDIKTREKFFIELDIELQKNQNKTILLAMHHPMFTNGTHGGYYAKEKHLYPVQKKIPLPILGSLVAQIRSQGGVSVQDRYNELYNKLMNRLASITKQSDRLVFASGHEHTMHHIEKDGIIQIQTGNGAKSSYATIGRFGEFSYGGQGFAVMTVFEDGSSWVRYFSVGENYTPKLLFEKEIIPPHAKYDVSQLLDIAKLPKEREAAIYTPDSINEALFFKTIWGQKYKNVYATPIKAKVGNLDSIFGGLKVIRENSSPSYKALLLRDKSGNEYSMRALTKSALQYLKKRDVPLDPQNIEDATDVNIDDELTRPEQFSSTFYTASHPYAVMAVPVMADAIDIFNTKPRLFYIPKQKKLGDYNESFGDELYYISIEPNENSEGQRTFEYPDDIESTDDILIKLRQRGDISLDEESYIKSRLFDMLIGDWDRESDHWRWAEYYNRDSLNVFVPIPKNRDDAFSNFEGTILDVAKSIFGSNNQKHIYDADLRDLKYFNKEGIILDRALLQRSGRNQWTFLAKEIQNTITDELIEKAFDNIPEEVRDETLEEIKTMLKARRENLAVIADRYYTYLATQQTIAGSNFNDFFEITRLADGRTNVKVYPNYSAKEGEPSVDRTFKMEDTHELWLYGLDGQDTFEIKGVDEDDLMFVRMIGGQGIDTFKLINGENSKVYDHESRESIIEEKNAGNVRFTDVYTLNTFDYRKQIERNNGYAALGGYNPDDGGVVGAQYTYQINSFQRNPFSQRHTGKVGYFIGTNSFDLSYEGEFANIMNNLNLSINAYGTSANFVENYFGYGNETQNPEEDLGIAYNQVALQTISASIGLLRNSSFGSYFKLQTKFDAITQSTTLNAANLPTSEDQLDNTQFFGTVEGIYNYRSFDIPTAPTRGMMFDLRAGATDNLSDPSRVFGFLYTRLGFYNSVFQSSKWVLKTNLQAGFNFDNKFEFYQGVKLGADSGLRGYRRDRFTGKSSLVGSADLRYSFDEFRIELIPINLGVYVGADMGKLWIPSQTSDKWHNDYGAGLWLNGSGGLNGSFSTFRSKEGTRYSFGLGFSF